MSEFLLELLGEEIPARMQAQGAADLVRLMTSGLQATQLSFDRIQSFVTPRRLGLVIEGLPSRQPDRSEERKGPRTDAPPAAIEGFLKASGLSTVAEAQIRETDKGRFYFAIKLLPGRPTPEALASLVHDSLLNLPWPKSMRWRDTEFRWVRPLHGILALFDGMPLPLTFALGARSDQPPPTQPLVADRTTRGHRFLAPERFEVHNAADYRTKLRSAFVIADPEERRQLIVTEAERLVEAEGLRLRSDEALLHEVTHLVEWPVVRLGRIDERFMDVPAEVLITAMRAHQKYFSVLTTDGRLAPRFVVVTNTPGTEGGEAIVAGNERVLRARLSDAKFFWDQDRKKTLASRVAKLSERVFHARLGSDLDRTHRLQHLARWLAPIAGADPDLAARGAWLCKADLTSEMVGEFPELQGTMGRYYAAHDGEAAEVAAAIAEHYAPQGPNDRAPSAPVSVAVALADKIDTLAGFFGIDEKPTGSRDPFALRRAALGIIRIVIENGLRLPLRAAFDEALGQYPAALSGDRKQATIDDLLGFFADRLKVHLKETGVRHDLIAAVYGAGGEDDLVRLLARVDALRDFLSTDDGANLLVAYRRASNIVRIEEKRDGTSYAGEAQARLFAEAQESELHQSLIAARQRITEALVAERFGEAMAVLAGLRMPVDAFFDKVQVNCADAQLRANRLRLLSQIRSALGGVADFSLIEG